MSDHASDQNMVKFVVSRQNNKILTICSYVSYIAEINRFQFVHSALCSKPGSNTSIPVLRYRWGNMQHAFRIDITQITYKKNKVCKHTLHYICIIQHHSTPALTLTSKMKMLSYFLLSIMPIKTDIWKI